ncbi:MAG: TolC family protein [Bdellovibrionota bacterium]
MGFLVAGWAQAETVRVSESSLLGLVEESTPSVARIHAALLDAKSQRDSYDEKFSPSFFAGGQIAETRERALISFAPVFSPTRNAQIGVQKSLPYGVDLTASVLMDQRSASSLSLTNGTSLTGALDLSIDLWKDLFGYTTRAKRRELAARAEKGELEEKINRKAFNISVRQLYWSLVANEESRKISMRLLETAEIQAKDAKKRLRNSIADKGEVARYESQVAQRRAQLTRLDYEKDEIVKQLMILLPGLATHELELLPYDLQATVAEVLLCTAQINTTADAPMQYTLYDQIIEKIEAEKNAQVASHDRYDDLDLKFKTRLKTTGVDNDADSNLGGAWSDISGNNRFGYEVGLELRIPLDGKKSDTSKLRALRDQLRSDAEAKELRTRIESTHRQIGRSIQYLSEVVGLLKENSAKLRIRLKDMEQKYAQARVSVTELVTEQDALLGSELNVVQTQLEALNALFAYLTVFTETPCSFNQR